MHLVLQNEPNLCSPANSPGLNVLVASAIQERGFKGRQRPDSDGMATSARQRETGTLVTRLQLA
jgi:hypothetical protein